MAADIFLRHNRNIFETRSIKYKFVKGEAFTSDDILIFNVQAYDKNRYRRIRSVKKYLGKYGKIVNISRVGKGQRPIYEIKYEEAKSAATALQRHDNSRYGFVVEPCDSLEQPDGLKFLAQKHTESDCHGIQNNEAPIMTLNDDCLEHICHFLRPRDQLKFAQSCRRFAAILFLFSKVHYKRFNYETLDGMTPFQKCQFLQIIGPQIKTLLAYGSREADAVNLYASAFFINVKRFAMLNSSENVLGKMMRDMDSLEEVVLDGCKFSDEFIAFLTRLKYLKSLKISDNCTVTGSGIQKLTGLEQLTIAYSDSIHTKLRDIFRNLKNLNYLDIIDNILDSSRYYRLIAKYLLQLKTLKINCRVGNYNCLADLPNLVNLAIDFENGEEFFAYLAERKADQLEELTIRSLKTNLRIATSVAQLKRLKVLKCFFDSDDEIMQQLAKLSELEDLDFYELYTMPAAFIKPILDNCLQLHRILLWHSNGERKLVICNAQELLKKCHEQGRRADCADFILQRPFEYRYDPATLENRNPSDRPRIKALINFIVRHEHEEFFDGFKLFF